MPSAAGYDVVIAGSGIAGLATAARVSAAGRSVLVVEKASTLGGSTRMSGGTVWTASSMEAMARYVPGGDRRLQQHLVDGFDEALAWLESRNVGMGERREMPERIVCQVDQESLILRLATHVEAHGGAIAVNTALAGVETDAAGAVTGATIASGNETWSVGADAVVLATGGFQGSPTLLSRYVPGHIDGLFLRSNPHSTGDGLVAALAAGGTTSSDMASFYGHTIPDTAAPIPSDRWTSVTPYYSQDAVLVDMNGERFFDESLSSADERAPMALVQRPSARGAIVFDDTLYGDSPHPERSPSRVGGSFEAAATFGAPTATADTLPELAAAMATWGVDADRFLRTIAAYNDAIEHGTSDALSPPRTRRRLPVTEPPFRALVVRPAITFTLGGIAVDDRYRVRADTSHVIAGLYAVGADAGGVYEGGYAGGLALGLVQSALLTDELVSL
jgi:succinate dehydrogenase/fumarate reductase flavoprotein subunit